MPTLKEKQVELKSRRKEFSIQKSIEINRDTKLTLPHEYNPKSITMDINKIVKDAQTIYEWLTK